MNLNYLDHDWFDDEFYKMGSFISYDGGQSIVFNKGGEINASDQIDAFENMTYIKIFFSDDYLIHNPAHTMVMRLNEVRTLVKSLVNQACSITSQGNQDKIFEDDFKKLRPLIPNLLSKAVLLSREEYIPSDSLKIKKNIIARSFLLEQGRAYGFWSKQMGIVGCTPETLFEIIDGTIFTEALAGTASLGEEELLLHSPKDRNEHNFVIADIQEKLISLGLQINVGETKTSPFSKIIHLRTPITAKMTDKVNIGQITTRLSPTAALGGYPTSQAMEFLESMDYSTKYPHRIFGSVIGHTTKNSVGLVMIRNLQWQENMFFIECGVGIVEDSNFAKELSEIRMKREVVRNHYL